MGTGDYYIMSRLISSILQPASEFSRMMKLKFRTKKSVIEFPFRVTFVDNVHIGRNVWIDRDAYFNLGKKCHLYIGDGTKIGRFCTFAGEANFIWIGKNVLFGPRVYIAASVHKYEDVTQPVITQGNISKGSVRINDDSWVGIGVTVLPNVTVGTHAIIGANSVVTRDISPYSVAAGTPAKILKKYDFKTQQWIRVKQFGNKVEEE